MDLSTGVSYHVERVRAGKSYLETDLVLVTVLKGRIAVQMEDHKISLPKGGILLISPGTMYEISAEEDTLMGKCAWTVEVLTQLLKGTHAYFYCNTATGYSRWHSELRKTLETLTGVYAAADHRTDSLIIGYLYKVLDCLIEHFQANNTIANRDYLNDSCFRAAFFTNEMMQIHDRADFLCVMAGTDWVSSYLDSGAVLHGGIGLLTKDTIRKPAYFALEFMNRLGGAVIASGDGYLLTRSESGSYYLLCSHFVPFEAGRYPVRAEDKPDLSVLHFEDRSAEVLFFRLSGIREQGYYCVKRRILSSESGSILDEWENFQFSENLTQDDLRYLRERCIPQIRMQKQYVGVEEELSFEVEMKPEDVVLLHIYRDQ